MQGFLSLFSPFPSALISSSTTINRQAKVSSTIFQSSIIKGALVANGPHLVLEHLLQLGMLIYMMSN